MTLHLSDMPQETRSDIMSDHTVLAPTKRSGVYRDVVKRGIDMFLILLSTPLVVPAILLMALVVARDGHNPFYSQTRIGKGGRKFRMWKIRTMVPDADALLETYLAENPVAKLEWDSAQKLRQDPRVTRMGRILRKTSLDELPQLWNVFIGDMSLVGPRPMMTEQEQFYYGFSYYNLRPGVTGLWQISDRNNCTFVGRIKYDDTYDETLSFKTDVSILIQTVGVVIKGTGF